MISYHSRIIDEFVKVEVSVVPLDSYHFSETLEFVGDAT